MSRVSATVSLFVAAGLFIGAMGGCKRLMPKAKYGKEFNAERLTRGISPIPESWNTYAVFQESTQWGNPLQSSGKWDQRSPLRSMKYVYYDKDQILKEEDTYYSGTKVKVPAEGDVDESMTVTYSYVAERKGENPWASHITWGPDAGDHTLQQARAILRKWGIPEKDIPGTKKAP